MLRPVGALNAHPSVLVVGADGLIGGALVRRLRADGIAVTGTTRRSQAPDASDVHLDLLAPGALPAADAVVLCAGVTSIIACARDPQGTAQANVAGIAKVAAAAAPSARVVLLLSSNQVFDGALPLRDRADAPCPVSEYGRQRAEAEAAILGLAGGAVLRLTKVLSADARMLANWRASLANGEAVTPFRNFPLAPITLDFAVEMIVRIVDAAGAGIFHASGAEDLSYADLALRLASHDGADPGLVRSIDAQAGAIGFDHLPRYSSLEMRTEANDFGLAAPASIDVVDEVLTDV